MGRMRSILKWFFRVALLAIVALGFVWLAIRIPRAYYRRQALQPPTSFVVENAPVIALVHARVIDGTGAAPLEDQTVVINAGRIVALGPAPSTSVPAGARTIGHRDLTTCQWHLYAPIARRSSRLSSTRSPYSDCIAARR